MRTLTRAEELLAVRAYLHWYERYGVGADEIAAGINGLLDVVEAYRPGGAGAAAAPQSPRGLGGYAARGDEDEGEDDGGGGGGGDDGDGKEGLM